jgi:thiamine-monophosphate kinase
MLYGGEDFELVLCLPEAAAVALNQQLADAAIIGAIVAGNIQSRSGFKPEFPAFLTALRRSLG